MADITTTIRNAKPGSMIDIRSPDGQIDAFPIERLWELLGEMEHETEVQVTTYQPHHQLI